MNERIYWVMAVCSFILIVLLAPQATPPLTGYATSQTGIASVNILSAVELTLVVNTVNFGNMSIGQSDDTSDNIPAPLILRNDGSVRVNVTVNRDPASQPLFSGTGGGDNTASFMGKIDVVAGENNAYNPACTVTAWGNIPGTIPVLAICYLNFADSKDEAEVDIQINVPSDEPVGSKSEALIFTAYQA